MEQTNAPINQQTEEEEEHIPNGLTLVYSHFRPGQNETQQATDYIEASNQRENLIEVHNQEKQSTESTDTPVERSEAFRQITAGAVGLHYIGKSNQQKEELPLVQEEDELLETHTIEQAEVATRLNREKLEELKRDSEEISKRLKEAILEDQHKNIHLDRLKENQKRKTETRDKKKREEQARLAKERKEKEEKVEEDNRKRRQRLKELEELEKERQQIQLQKDEDRREEKKREAEAKKRKTQEEKVKEKKRRKIDKANKRKAQEATQSRSRNTSPQGTPENLGREQRTTANKNPRYVIPGSPTPEEELIENPPRQEEGRKENKAVNIAPYTDAKRQKLVKDSLVKLPEEIQRQTTKVALIEVLKEAEKQNPSKTVVPDQPKKDKHKTFYDTGIAGQSHFRKDITKQATRVAAESIRPPVPVLRISKGKRNKKRELLELAEKADNKKIQEAYQRLAKTADKHAELRRSLYWLTYAEVQLQLRLGQIAEDQEVDFKYMIYDINKTTKIADEEKASLIESLVQFVYYGLSLNVDPTRWKEVRKLRREDLVKEIQKKIKEDTKTTNEKKLAVWRAHKIQAQKWLLERGYDDLLGHKGANQYGAPHTVETIKKTPISNNHREIIEQDYEEGTPQWEAIGTTLLPCVQEKYINDTAELEELKKGLRKEEEEKTNEKQLKKEEKQHRREERRRQKVRAHETETQREEKQKETQGIEQDIVSVEVHQGPDLEDETILSGPENTSEASGSDSGDSRSSKASRSSRGSGRSRSSRGSRRSRSSSDSGSSGSSRSSQLSRRTDNSRTSGSTTTSYKQRRRRVVKRTLKKRSTTETGGELEDLGGECVRNHLHNLENRPSSQTSKPTKKEAYWYIDEHTRTTITNEKVIEGSKETTITTKKIERIRPAAQIILGTSRRHPQIERALPQLEIIGLIQNLLTLLQGPQSEQLIAEENKQRLPELQDELPELQTETLRTQSDIIGTQGESIEAQFNQAVNYEEQIQKTQTETPETEEEQEEPGSELPEPQEELTVPPAETSEAYRDSSEPREKVTKPQQELPEPQQDSSDPPIASKPLLKKLIDYAQELRELEAKKAFLEKELRDQKRKEILKEKEEGKLLQEEGELLEDTEEEETKRQKKPQHKQ